MIMNYCRRKHKTVNKLNLQQGLTQLRPHVSQDHRKTHHDRINTVTSQARVSLDQADTRTLVEHISVRR